MAISMKQAAPAPAAQGSSISKLFQERRLTLMENPGVWYEYSNNLRANTMGSVLSSLCGVKLPALKGINRKLLPYQVASRRMEDGTYSVFARYVGEQQEWV
jgi:hypothetical protein